MHVYGKPRELPDTLSEKGKLTTLVKGIVVAAFSPTGVDRCCGLSKLPKVSKDAVLSVASCILVLLENGLSYEEALKINSRFKRYNRLRSERHRTTAMAVVGK